MNERVEGALPEEGRERMKKLYEESFAGIEEGKLVKGKIAHVDEKEVVVDIGYKSEGVISIWEFPDPGQIKVGDEVEVLLEAMESENGTVVLSRREADRIKGWERLEELYKKGEVVEGLISRQVKGGFKVDVGAEAFLPASQVSLRLEKNLEQFVGKKYKFKILKMDRQRRNVVVSRRSFLEEERVEKKAELLTKLEEGEICSGEVKNITDFGAFIDLGGMDGLLHITDMTWGRVSHPSEVLAVGDKVEVVVLKLDKEAQRISLGMKQKTPDPWLTIEEKYPVGSRQKGKVVNITDYGAFVELEEGVEGLIHISEMSWTRRISHPSEVLAIGDVVEGVILSVDKGARRLSLGMRQVEPNPWIGVKEKYLEGSKIEGKIRNVTDYGAFVELEDGIDGLIHISDMSWASGIEHPSEIVKKGDVMEAVVLKVDPERKRISLGIKQLTEDPWLEIPNRYKEGDHVKGKVVKIVPFGAFVEIEKNVEGLIHISQLARERVEKVEGVLAAGDGVDAKVIKVDPEQRRIRLSVKEYLEETGGKKEEEEKKTKKEIGKMAVIVEKDYDAMSKKAAELLAGEMKKKEKFVLGLATGSTPIGLYKELIRMHKEEGLDFSNVVTFNLDEYCGLAKDHEQSYNAFMYENLFNHVNVKDENVHIPDGLAADVAAFCENYERMIKEAGGVDLQVLGIGGDGHIGFNEPGSALDSRTREVDLDQQTIEDNARFFEKKEDVPRTAITMGVGTIMEARTCLMLANGVKKAEVLAKAVEGPVTMEITASALQNHPNTIVIVDEGAAAKLKK